MCEAKRDGIQMSVDDIRPSVDIQLLEVRQVLHRSSNVPVNQGISSIDRMVSPQREFDNLLSETFVQRLRDGLEKKGLGDPCFGIGRKGHLVV